MEEALDLSSDRILNEWSDLLAPFLNKLHKRMALVDKHIFMSSVLEGR